MITVATICILTATCIILAVALRLARRATAAAARRHQELHAQHAETQQALDRAYETILALSHQVDILKAKHRPIVLPCGAPLVTLTVGERHPWVVRVANN